MRPLIVGRDPVAAVRDLAARRERFYAGATVRINGVGEVHGVLGAVELAVAQARTRSTRLLDAETKVGRFVLGEHIATDEIAVSLERLDARRLERAQRAAGERQRLSEALISDDRSRRASRHAVLIDYADRWSFNLIGGPLFAAKRRVERNTRRYHVFDREQLVREFATHGFGRPAIRPEFFLPMVVHRGVGKVRFTRLVEGASRRSGVTRLLGSPVILRVERILDGR